MEIKDKEGKSINGVSLQLARDDGQALSGKTGVEGLYRFTGLDPGDFQLRLPEWDARAWFVKEINSLDETEANCYCVASWQKLAPPAKITAEQRHIVKQGECVGKIAERYGFLAHTIWEDPANAGLRLSRHDNMHILYKDDQIVIPVKRESQAAVTAGQRITVLLQGIQSYLRIRFLHYDETPRANVPYTLSLMMANKSIPVPDISSRTDADGLVNRPVPLGVLSATITLYPGPDPEIYTFNVGHTNPIDTVSGWKSRLRNLGYYRGPEDEEFGPQIKAAIQEFQQAKGLHETGEMDDATKAALLEITSC